MVEINEVSFSGTEQLEMLAKMIQEMRITLLRSLMVDRVMRRKELIKTLSTGDLNVDGQNRSTISQLRGSLEMVQAIHKELLESEGKA